MSTPEGTTPHQRSGMLNALLDRRDITASREQPEHLTVMDLTETNRLLREVVSALHVNNEPEEIVFVDSTFQPSLIVGPSGMRRRVLNRSPIPPANLTVTTTGVLLYQPNVNRYGGEIVNTGSNTVTLVLGIDIGEPTGAPVNLGAGWGTIMLTGNGGSWDFRLSDALWCGSVWAFATGGSSTVTGAEI